MPEGLSMRAFAKKEGCSHTAVQKAVRDGHLPMLAGGRLDPALIGTAWRAGNRGNLERAVATGLPDVPPGQVNGETLAAAALRTLEEAGFLHTRADAERIKENFLALLRQLEFETKSRLVLPRADVDLAMDQAMLIFRSNLESIAGRLAAELAGISSAAVIKDRLTHEHHRVLHACADRFERLAADAAPDGADAPPGAEADGGPVGKRRPRAAGGKRRAGPVPQ